MVVAGNGWVVDDGAGGRWPSGPGETWGRGGRGCRRQRRGRRPGRTAGHDGDQGEHRQTAREHDRPTTSVAAWAPVAKRPSDRSGGTFGYRSPRGHSPRRSVTPAGSGRFLALLDQQRQRGTGGDGAASEVFEVKGDRGRVDDRVAPVVEADDFGKQLGAETVTVAGDGVDSQMAGHISREGHQRRGRRVDGAKRDATRPVSGTDD